MSLYVAIYIFQTYKLDFFQGHADPDLIFASYILRGALLILVSVGCFLLGLKHIMYSQSSAVLVGAYASFSATALFHAFLLISDGENLPFSQTTQGYVSYAVAACALAQAILLLFVYIQDMNSGSGGDTGAGMRSPTLIFLSVLNSASCIMLGAVYSYSYTQLKAGGMPQLYLDYAVGTAVYFFFFAVVLLMPSFTRGSKGTIHLTLAVTSFIVGMMSLIDGLYLNYLIGGPIANVQDTIDASYAGAAAEFFVFAVCFGMGMYDSMSSGKSA